MSNIDMLPGAEHHPFDSETLLYFTSGYDLPPFQIHLFASNNTENWSWPIHSQAFLKFLMASNIIWPFWHPPKKCVFLSPATNSEVSRLLQWKFHCFHAELLHPGGGKATTYTHRHTGDPGWVGKDHCKSDYTVVERLLSTYLEQWFHWLYEGIIENQLLQFYNTSKTCLENDALVLSLSLTTSQLNGCMI